MISFLERGDLSEQFGQAGVALLLKLEVAPVIPTFQHVGDVVVGGRGLALIVELLEEEQEGKLLDGVERVG